MSSIKTLFQDSAFFLVTGHLNRKWKGEYRQLWLDLRTSLFHYSSQILTPNWLRMHLLTLTRLRPSGSKDFIKGSPSPHLNVLFFAVSAGLAGFIRVTIPPLRMSTMLLSDQANICVVLTYHIFT